MFVPAGAACQPAHGIPAASMAGSYQSFSAGPQRATEGALEQCPLDFTEHTNKLPVPDICIPSPARLQPATELKQSKRKPAPALPA